MWTSALIVFSTISLGLALECFVCTNQENNKEKCIDTIKTCEQDEKLCLTEVKWGSPPYWSRGNAKQFYVSKRCSTQDTCNKLISKTMPFCTYIWYYDWRCVECCAGDRCNHYVTLAGSTVYSSKITIVASIIFLTIAKTVF